MNTLEKKQPGLIIDISTDRDDYRFNSSGRVKKPLVFNKRRNPLAYVVDWQIDESEENLLE